MAKIKIQVPYELMQQFNLLSNGGAKKMIEEMTQAGAKVAYNNVKANMRKAFKDTSRLEKNLKMTDPYRTPSDDGINTKVAFYGYLDEDKAKTISHTFKGKTYTRVDTSGLTPAPLVAMAREYGTSKGEAKKPFLRPAFRKAEIEKAMLKVQEHYIKNE